MTEDYREVKCMSCVHWSKGEYEHPCRTCKELHFHYDDEHTEENYQRKETK